MSHGDEMKQLFHELQVLIGRELTKGERGMLDNWMWDFEFRRFKYINDQMYYWMKIAKNDMRSFHGKLTKRG